MKTIIKNTKGFSALESILSTVILSVGLIGGLLIMQNATAKTMEGDLNTVASQFASEKIEEVMADKEYRGFDYLVAGNYPNESGLSYDMQRAVSITEVSESDLSTPQTSSGLKKVDVTVTWGDEDHEAVTVSTLIVNYE